MKPLYVALIVKPAPVNRERDTRNKGYLSYAVPEFTWEHFYFGRDFNVDTGDFKRQGFDLIVHEDGGNWGKYSGHAIPVAMIIYDSTLSPAHYEERLLQARQADLILVDHDDLAQFECTGKPVYRFPHCVNDKLYRDTGEERTIDVSFNCGKQNCDERRKLDRWLVNYCHKHALIYSPGLKPHTEYAGIMARAKIVANWPRTPTNRPHRIFDAMACGACVVTGPLPDVSGDMREAGHDYIQVNELRAVPGAIDKLLKSGQWREIAQNGHELVMAHHTWAIRARQLRGIIETALKL